MAEMSSSAVSGASSPYVLVGQESSGGEKEAQHDETSFVEPIAIVGMGCRLPGDVNSPSQLWDLLIKSRTGQCDVPKSRWDVNSFYHPKGADRPGSMNTKGGYFLKEDIRSFENAFFGINNLEATHMDPQQRKLLEVVFECFENAGVRLEDVSGSDTGCYVGNFTMDFLLMQGREPEYYHRYTATGMGTTILANRISHAFNLQGPSMVLDTACSSSLYCLHTAVVALRNRECDAAIVAGTNLIQSPEQHMATMKAGVLSGTSTCHTFDISADGYGRADGVGALYIKRLSDAIRDGDPIRSIIRATAVNANGKTQGITLPSATAQEAVIRKAHAVAGLSLNETAYVECHGTGTAVGDPIEVEAISRAFAGRPSGSPLLVGAVKPNLGHSEAASGISAIIKATLALEAGLIPPTIGVNTVQPKIKTNEWNIEIVTRNTPWPFDPSTSAIPRRAGVNSFGYGGANAHAILEAADAFLPPNYHKSSVSGEILELLDKNFVLPFSGSSAESLASRVSGLVAGRLNISDLAFTLSERRSKLPVRGFLIASQSGLKQDLQSCNLQTQLSTSNNRLNSPFAFVFTGQGAQWAEMGKGLIEQFPLARACIQQMDATLRKLPHPPAWSLVQILTEPREVSRINEVTHSQPACTAIQIAMVDLLAHWGITPQGVVGHSSGEMAAAYAAGLLTVEQAIVIAYYRGYVVGKSSTKGLMMAVGLSQVEAQDEIDKFSLTGKIVVACVNSPVSVTISGDADAIDTLYSKLGPRNVFRRKLVTNERAYHSHHMKAIGQEYEALVRSALRTLKAPLPKLDPVHFISSVTTQPILSFPGADYWRSNLESPVLFSQALQVLQTNRAFQLIEIGPHAALKLPVTQIRTRLGIAEADLPYYSALSRGEDSSISLLKLMGNLFLSGLDISFQKVNAVYHIGNPSSKQSRGTMVKDLPPYEWTYDQILMSEARASLEFRFRKYPRHELLGSMIPGGNLADYSWKNILQVKDVPWLEDHKLDQTVVLPAAAYVAMAIEAMSQTLGRPLEEDESIELQHVHILSALTLSALGKATSAEVFTTLQRQRLSGTTKSKTWWQFEIVSVREQISVIHATGTVGHHTFNQSLSRCLSVEEDSMEKSAIRNWYGKLAKEGLNFGPEFQSIKDLQISRAKTLRHVIAEAPLLQRGPNPVEEDSKYYIHPITLDAMLQAGIMSTSGGVIQNLHGQIPVKIDRVIVKAAPYTAETHIIEANSDQVGFGQTSMFAELYSRSSRVYAQLFGIRMVSYVATAADNSIEERHPMLRVIWKPDIYGLGIPDPKTLNAALERHQVRLQVGSKAISDAAILKMLAAVDLISHKNPRLRILQLSGGDCSRVTHAFLDTVRYSTAFPRCQSFNVGKLTSNGILLSKDVSKNSLENSSSWSERVNETLFDLVIIPEERDCADLNIDSRFYDITMSLAPLGLLLASVRANDRLLSAKETYNITSCGLSTGGNLLALAQKISGPLPNYLESARLVVVEENTNTPLGLAIEEKLRSLSDSVNHVSLKDVTLRDLPPKCTVIMAVEAHKSLLSVANDTEMRALKLLTDNASTIVWVSESGLLECEHPDEALVGGLSRALMLEQPSLKFLTLDLDGKSSLDLTAQHVVDILSQANAEGNPDLEFAQHHGILHVSRFLPDEYLNETFQKRQGGQAVKMTLQNASNSRLKIQTVGQFETLCFEQEHSEEPLRSDYVEVKVKSVGLNAKDYSVLSGKTETKNGTCALEYSGTITAVGSSVTQLAIGDNVVVMAPNHFKLLERAPQWACVKMQNEEDFNTMSTLCLVHATAIYGLHNRGQMQAGESVLIHCGTGGLGMAAIRIAKLAGAKIFTTVGTSEKREYLAETFGLNPDHIFSSRDSTFLEGISKATSGRGVDIVLNSLTGDLLQDSWKACAEFGRFIEVGKRDVADSGSLDMSLFSRNVTFTAFELTSLFHHADPSVNKIWQSLMKNVLDLYRSRQIAAIEPLKVFDISKTAEAFRSFSEKDRIGKIAISLEDAESEISVIPFKHASKFSANKSYLLVGCLGGLGGALAKWMMTRGARKFVFLGRSGIDRLSARNLVEDLQHAGAEVTVIRGDVINFSDVQRAVDAINGTLGGVIQAAMGLSEALFTTMSNDSWHISIDPKVQGTWNLHNAIKKKESEERLEFFLMTSSSSGSVGTATESNYCAANYFLDAFARYRKQQGLPAISLGLGVISEVGYLHENPEIEALLLRKGIQAINEDELIQIVDLALTSQENNPQELCYDRLASSHILTGLEPQGLKDLRKKGFEGNNIIFSDPRASILATALGVDGPSRADQKSSVASARLTKSLESSGPEKSIRDSILGLTVDRFSNLILIPLAKVDVARPLSAYGMDSMIAAEFRSWIYHAFKTDIPFLELLSETVSLNSLIDVIEKEVKAAL